MIRHPHRGTVRVSPETPGPFGRMAVSLALDAVLALGALPRAVRGAATALCRDLKRRRRWATLEGLIADHGCAESTAAKYAACVRQFFVWRGSEDLQPTPGQIRAFLDYQTARGLSSATVRVHLAALRKLFDRILGMDCTLDMTYPQAPPPRPPAEPQQVMHLFGAADSAPDRLHLQLLGDGILRPAQITLLGEDHLSADSRYLHLAALGGKAGAPDWIELSEETARLLESLRTGQPGACFFHRRGRPDCPVSVRWLGMRFRRLALRAGEPVTRTAVRKTAALRAAA